MIIKLRRDHRSRKVHGKGGALLQNAYDADRPAVVFKDAFADRESQTSPFPLFLGGDERVKNRFKFFSRDADSVIFEPDRNRIPEGRTFRRNPERPPRGHRVQGIEDQIDEDLSQLFLIGMDTGQVFGIMLDLDLVHPDLVV